MTRRRTRTKLVIPSVSDVLRAFARPITDCHCGGDCLCHTMGSYGGVFCPPECANSSVMFDGCHRCDCHGTGGIEPGRPQYAPGTTEEQKSLPAVYIPPNRRAV